MVYIMFGVTLKPLSMAVILFELSTFVMMKAGMTVSFVVSQPTLGQALVQRKSLLRLCTMAFENVAVF
jgi:hypothetical protein